MITFREGKYTFVYRVVGIALHRGRVLLHQVEGWDFWSLPGGRGEFLEASADTLRREMREELGCTVQVERLVWVAENFFEDDGRSFHELGFYYQMALPPDSPLCQSDGPFARRELTGEPLIFRWFPLAEVGRLPLYPTFLRSGLQALPKAITHIVHIDGA